MQYHKNIFHYTTVTITNIPTHSQLITSEPNCYFNIKYPPNYCHLSLVNVSEVLLGSMQLLQPFYGPWTSSGTTQVSWYQKGKTRKVQPIWIYWSNRQWVAVASARPYANLHLAPDNHASILPRSFLQAGCPSCRPTNSVKALEATGGRYASDKNNTAVTTTTAASAATDWAVV